MILSSSFFLFDFLGIRQHIFMFYLMGFIWYNQMGVNLTKASSFAYILGHVNIHLRCHMKVEAFNLFTVFTFMVSIPFLLYTLLFLLCLLFSEKSMDLMGSFTPSIHMRLLVCLNIRWEGSCIMYIITWFAPFMWKKWSLLCCLWHMPLCPFSFTYKHPRFLFLSWAN